MHPGYVVSRAGEVKSEEPLTGRNPAAGRLRHSRSWLINSPSGVLRRRDLGATLRIEHGETVPRGGRDAALGDEAGDEPGGRHVEPKIGRGTRGRRDRDAGDRPIGEFAGDMRDFAAFALLDGNGAAVG